MGMDKGQVVMHFVRRSDWGMADFVALFASMLVLFWVSTPVLFPASQIIRLHKTEVFDAFEGQELFVSVTRTLLRKSNNVRYEVQVRELNTWNGICQARHHPASYDPKSTIDPEKPLEFDWWAYDPDGHCVDWVPTIGQYVMLTRHCVRRFWWMVESCNPWTESNTFTIIPAAPSSE